MDNSRTILAVVLIVLLWSAYSLFFTQPQISKPLDSVQTDNAEKTDNTHQKNFNTPLSTLLPESTSVENKIESVGTETIIKVNSELFYIEFTTAGAAVKKFTLKKYKNVNSQDSENYPIFESDNENLSTLILTGSDTLIIPSNLNYTLVSTDLLDINLLNEMALTFQASYNGLLIKKTYLLKPDSYAYGLNVEIVNQTVGPLSGRVNLSLITPYDKNRKAQMYSFEGPESYDGVDLLDDKIKDIEKSPKIYGQRIVWSGFTTKYFFTAIKPFFTIDQLFIGLGDNFIENKFYSEPVTIRPEQSVDYNYSVYFGPRQLEILASSGQQFEETINYGFFHPLAKPLIVVLKFFYKYVGNYGVAIILLTICIKLIFWPLTHKSYKSMKGMQRLQPEMKRLREKYGSDKQKLNQELMAFYKTHKVNPLGGCLPMLIQIPVFFALYRVLLGSIELRHAPFMLWITDLSAKDPYYVTPLIMGVTMFLQQKMTPTNMDPMQEKVMLMMPVIFTFMFLNFPSGLVIYWLVNNLLTILQQYLIRRQPD